MLSSWTDDLSGVKLHRRQPLLAFSQVLGPQGFFFADNCFSVFFHSVSLEKKQMVHFWQTKQLANRIAPWFVEKRCSWEINSWSSSERRAWGWHKMYEILVHHSKQKELYSNSIILIDWIYKRFICIWHNIIFYINKFQATPWSDSLYHQDG